MHGETDRRRIAAPHPITVHRIVDSAADLLLDYPWYWRHVIVPDFEKKAALILWYYERVAVARGAR